MVSKNLVKAQAGRIGGFAKAARYLPQELTLAARRGFLGRFLKEVDDHSPELPGAERQRRARLLLRAHMAKLAMRSAAARRGGGSRG